MTRQMTAGHSFDDDPNPMMVERASKAHLRETQRRRVAIADFRLRDTDRLTDRTRATLSVILRSLVTELASNLWQRVRCQLEETGASFETISTDAIHRCLIESGMLADSALLRELIGRSREAELADALSPMASDLVRPSLLVRLVESPDPTIADLARRLLAAEAHRRDDAAGPGRELPSDIQQRLVWMIAAAVRAQLHADAPRKPELDHAIGEASTHIIDLHDESQSIEAAATRLAAAIDARPAELAPLLIESLADQRLPLFIAVVAEAASLDYAAVREVVLEPDGDRFLLLLFSLGLDRRAIAQIALAITDADPRRDADRLPDQIDEAMAVPLTVITTILSPLRLHAGLRQAIDQLALGAEQ